VLFKIPSVTYNASTHPPVHSHVPVLPEALATRILDWTCPPSCVLDASPSPLACPRVPWCSLDMSSTWTNMPFNALLRIALLTCLILACTASCYMSCFITLSLLPYATLTDERNCFQPEYLFSALVSALQASSGSLPALPLLGLRFYSQGAIA
jgi:hypothetical protein